MNANKIELNGEVLIDLTKDTAQDGDVTLGKTYHRADGSLGVGTHECEVGIQPSGTLLITANDEYDVTNYAKAQVDVPAIIEVTELPTTNIDTNAVYSMGGKLYRYEKFTATNVPTDLTGYTVTVPSGWTATAGYGVFNVNADVTYGDQTKSFVTTSVRIGYSRTGDNSFQRNAHYVSIDSTFFNFSITDLTFKFTGGADKQDSSLIQWFVDNSATFKSEGYEWVEYLAPEGELAITENGTHDVSDKASVKVDVPIPALEGTAIPVGEVVEKIYFNTNNTIEETNAYLSQLTFIEGVYDYPIYLIYAYAANSFLGLYLVVFKLSDNSYTITAISDIETQAASDVYNTLSDELKRNNGFSVTGVSAVESRLINGIYINETSLTEWNGLPIGAENEKIKNVMSITPFVAEGEIIAEWDGSFTKSNKELISFTFEGEILYAEKGMTWATWLTTGYSDDNFEARGDYVAPKYAPTDYYIADTDKKRVKVTDEISNGATYILTNQPTE